MNRRNRILLITIALVCTFIMGCSAAFQPTFSPMPMDMKNTSEGKSYSDDAFLAEATDIVSSISNKTLPTGDLKNEVSGAYLQFISDNVSPEFWEKAHNIVGFFYYTAKAGEAYEDYIQYRGSVSASTDGSEYYELSSRYYAEAVNYWNAIKDLFPEASMYKMPGQNDEISVDEVGASSGTVLEGLEMGIPMTQKEPDGKKLYTNDEFLTTTTRWFEDYVNDLESEVNISEQDKQSAGYIFMNGDGIKETDYLYLNMVGMNVDKDFMDTANYVDAFFYFLSKSKESYDQYITDLTSVVSVQNGQTSYDTSKNYYLEAEKASEKFRELIPEGVNATLPVFPMFNEFNPESTDYGSMLSYWDRNSWTPAFDNILNPTS